MLNQNDDQNEAKKLMLMCVLAASVVLLMFLVILYMHEEKKPKKHATKIVTENNTEEKEIEIKKSNLVSSDLDFWDMYEDTKEENVIIDDSKDESDSDSKNSSSSSDKKINQSKSSSSDKTTNRDDSDEELSMNIKKNKDKDKMDDGKHIKVTGPDGKAQWFEILDDVKKNSFDFENYLTYDNGLLKYEAGDIKSIVGIDVSSRQGIIDFSKVKNAGVDFVMIKVASRGYETGQINIDEKFVEYANAAVASGLSIGAYVSSQAITDVEAVEEANYAVAAANNYNVKYPIAIDFTSANSQSQRTDRLTSEERTAIVKKFCETVKSYGKIPAIRATRDFLITELDLTELSDYDIWLKDEAVTADYMKFEYIEDNDSSSSSSSSSAKSSSSSKLSKSESTDSDSSSEDEKPEYIGTDYPYEFAMWQYTNKGTINGIEGPVNVNMSFVNYAER